MRRLLPVLLSLAFLACGKDHLVKKSCPETVLQTSDETVTTTTSSTTSQSAFDIDQVSSLEATDSLPRGADAVILDHDASQVPANATWRVSSVDVLVMIRSTDFPGYPGSVGHASVGLTVQVWDANTPVNTQKPAYELRQVLDPAALTWTSATLSTGSYRRAWWTFKFAEGTTPIIPATGMSAPQFLVGAKWDSSGEPQLGYSNFNRPCNRNWTDTGTGGWKLNSSLGNSNSCNWPMMRVSTEVITQVTTTQTVPVTHPVTVMVERDECDPNAVETVIDGGTDADAGVDAGAP